MTDLNKPVKRVTHGMVRERGLRPVVVILRPPNVLGFRAKGCRKEYQLTAEVCWSLAVKAEAAANARVKRLARKLK